MARLHPNSLEVAVAIAETGSVGRAATRLHLSQPAVSYHLRKLERAIGGSLFVRGAGGMVPTPAGARMVAGARQALAEVDRAIDEARRIMTEATPVVRVSSSCFTNYYWLPRVLDELGDVRVELDVDPGRRPFERLDRGELDVALTTEPPERGPFRSVELFRDEVVAVVAKRHRLAGRERVGAADFEQESVAVFDRRQSDLCERVLGPAGVRPRHVSDVPVTEALLELVRAGVAVTAMARWIVEPELRAGRLVAIRIGADGILRRWHAVLSNRHAVPEAAERFVSAMKRRPGGHAR